MGFADPEAKREYDREYKKKWMVANPGYWKKWPKRSKEESVRLQRQWRENNPEKELYIQAKCRAKKNGILFTIRFEDILWSKKCPVFKTPLSYDKAFAGRGKGKARANQATLDRRDNSKGYVPGNVFVISHRANRLKSDMTKVEIAALWGYILTNSSSG